MSEPRVTEEEMLRALEAMYVAWFMNGPANMPTEGRHKEIYNAIRALIEKFFEWQKKARELDALAFGNKWAYKMAEIAMEIGNFEKEAASD